MKSHHYVVAIIGIVIVFLLFQSVFQQFSDDSIPRDGPNEKTEAQTQSQHKTRHAQATFKSVNQIRFELLATPDSSISNLDDESQVEEISNSGFRSCRMSTCFDFSNCPANKPLKVAITRRKSNQVESNQTSGESNIIHSRILDIIKNSRFYEPQASQACIYVPEEDTLDRDPLSISFRSHLTKVFGPEDRYGMNYLVFNLYSGTWPSYSENDFAGLQLGAAMVAKASNSIIHHRPGFDISLPLFSYQHPTKDANIKLKNETSNSREYFMTFKGKRYVFGDGSLTRNNLYHIDNDRDIIMLTTCRHGKKWQESKDNRCDQDEIRYGKFDFEQLMRKSTYCLTPRGRRLGSFRFLEALQNGCIPIVLSDGWVWPFDDLIDWSRTAMQIDETWLIHMPEFLRSLNPKLVESMRKNCLALYDKYFSSIERIILTTLSIIEKRIQNRF